jgi:superfamily I DNA/RNA helicase
VPFPSDEQRAVIDHRGRPMVVIAGPGTGKTKTLVERMITLLKEDSNRNISFVTFTRTSRTDTSRKLASEFPSDKLEDDTQEFPRVGTMHGSARTILHRFARIIDFDPNFNIFIAEKGERSLIVSEVIDDLGLGFSIPVVEAAIVYMLCNLTELEADKIEPELQVQLFERYHE